MMKGKREQMRKEAEHLKIEEKEAVATVRAVQGNWFQPSSRSHSFSQKLN